MSALRAAAAAAVLVVAAAASLRAESGDDGVWITLSREDLPGLGGAGVSLGASILSSEGVEVLRVRESMIPALSSAMHERFKKCGGFFAHANRAEAEAALAAPPAAAARAYTVDQAAVVSPLVAAVSEGELRATISGLSARHDRHYQSDEGVAAAEDLAARWRKLVRGVPGAAVELVAHAAWKQPSVVATIPGSDLAEETVVLGGHLDSINSRGGAQARAPGADDNASGLAVLTETLRVLASGGHRPRRTLVFAGYAAEEAGLRGSSEIARRWRDEGRSVAGVLQFDMTNFAGSGDKLFFITDNTHPALTAYLGKLADAYAGAPWGTLACGYACSDHASWTRNGYPAGAAFESDIGGVNPGIHTERDTLATSGGTAAHSVKYARLAVAFAVETGK